MKPYADYDFYEDEYCGNCISEDIFNRYAIEASGYLNQITLGRIKEPTDEVKMATCAIADICYKQSKSEEQEIASETVGPHSVIYVKKSKTLKEYNQEKFEKANIYLMNTGLLYRGVSCSS